VRRADFDTAHPDRESKASIYGYLKTPSLRQKCTRVAPLIAMLMLSPLPRVLAMPSALGGGFSMAHRTKMGEGVHRVLFKWFRGFVHRRFFSETG
jgi:hypothetical protein